MPDKPSPPPVHDLTSSEDTVPRGLPLHAVTPTQRVETDSDSYAAAIRPVGMPERLGPYRLVKPLGRGGMGAVYLAEDTQLRRPTALKMMLPEAAADAKARDRFLREARAAAAVRNDYVVTVYQVGDEDGTPYIAMELLRGSPLDIYLARESAPTMTAIVRLAREIASGLAAAHAKGLVHRDIKPANIWLEAPRGRVKILDFGLARPAKPETEDVERLTHDGMVMGTPSYMSPEQARGEAVDFRTDLFSLGIVLYRLCTGQLPFTGPTTTAVLTQLAVFHPPLAGDINPNVPQALSDLIDRLLSKEPADRPKTTREVVDVLRQIDMTPARAIQVTAPTKTARRPAPELEVITEVEEDAPPVRSGPRRRRRRRKTFTGDWLVGIGAVVAMVALAVGIPLAIYKAIPARKTADTKSQTTPAPAGNTNATVTPQPAPPPDRAPPVDRPVIRREEPRPEPPPPPPWEPRGPRDRPPPGSGGPPPRPPGGPSPGPPPGGP
jgi:serine/threonine protein kinase